MRADSELETPQILRVSIFNVFKLFCWIFDRLTGYHFRLWREEFEFGNFDFGIARVPFFSNQANFYILTRRFEFTNFEGRFVIRNLGNPQVPIFIRIKLHL